MHPLPADLSRYPYPVARPAAVASGLVPGATFQTRIWDVTFATYQLLRMSTLPVLADYLASAIATEDMPQPGSVASIAEAAARLRCPHYSDWATLLHALAKHVTIERVRIASCLPLPRAVAALKQAPGIDYLDRVRYGPRDPREAASPLALMQFLRNGLAHGGELPGDADCERLLAHYLPALDALLGAFSFLADCELRGRDPDARAVDEGTLARVLRGTDPAPEAPIGDDERWLTALEASPVALETPEGRVIPLWPIFTVGPTSPVGLYDGHYVLETLAAGAEPRPVVDQRIFYLGVGHDRWADERAIEKLREQLERRRVAWRVDKAAASADAVADALRWSAHQTLLDLEGTKYFPACHVEREPLRALTERFLAVGEGALRHRAGLVLVGLAGAGKTAWTAHLAVRLLREGVPDQAGDEGAREGNNLVLFLRGDQVPLRPGLDALLAVALERMGLRSEDFASWGKLLRQLDKHWDRARGRRLVVLLDAVNEAPQPEVLLAEALALVRDAAAFPWCKVVLTVRRELLDVLRGKAGPQEKDVWLRSGARDQLWVEQPPYAHRRLGEPNDPVIELPPFVEAEAREAYERYRERGLADRPGCATEWSRLGDETRALLRAPLLLHAFHHRFGGVEAEPVRGREALLEAYLDGLLREYPGLEAAIDPVIARLLDHGRSELSPEDEHELRRAWAESRSPAETRLELSPVEALAHAGLLRRRPAGEGRGTVFAFQTVLELLIARSWRRRDPALSVEFLRQQLRDGVARTQGVEYWNAFGFVLHEWLQRGRARDWPALVDGESPPEVNGVAAQVWAAAVVATGLPSDAPAEALLATPSGEVVAAYGARADEKWAFDRLRSLAAHVYELRPEWVQLVLEAMREGVTTAVEAGRSELENHFAEIDTEIGKVLYTRGDLDGAVAAYDHARGVFQRLVDGGRCELENHLAGVDMNLGNALAARGDLDSAVAAHERARAVRQRLVDEGRRELEGELALVEMNLGNALATAGDLDGAAAAHERARALFQHLVARGRREFENDLAAADMNFGTLLDRRGDLDGAIAAYERARALFQRLVAEGRCELEQKLAVADLNLGVALAIGGDLDHAVAAFERSRAVLLRLVAEGRRELENNLASVEVNLGIALASRGDLDGAVAAYERARALRQRLVDEGRGELESELALVDTNLGVALQALGDLDGAVGAQERARTVLLRLVAEGRRELENPLATVDMNLGNALSTRGDIDGAVAAYERARAVRQRLIDGGRSELESDLAAVDTNLGKALRTRGDVDGAVAAYQRARAVLQRLIDAGRSELESDLAAVDTNLGTALQARGDLDGAVAAYQRARALWERLVAEGRRELVSQLAIVDGNLGTALQDRGDLDCAEAALVRARAVIQRLIAEGRRELENQLARVDMNLGHVLRTRGDLDGAIAAFERARAVPLRLVTEGRRELENELAKVDMNLGIALASRGDLDRAVAAFERARAVLLRLVTEGRRELEDDLAKVDMNLGIALASRGDLDGAVAAIERAHVVLLRLVTGGRRELEGQLATVDMNLGNALHARGDLDGAVAAYERARAVLLRLVADGRRELEGELVKVETNLGVALASRGDLDGAVAAFGRARAVLLPLVAEGHPDFEPKLAKVDLNLGIALASRGDLDGAVAAFERACAALLRLVAEGRDELKDDLAKGERLLVTTLADAERWRTS